MFGLDAERAHELGIEALRLGLASPFYQASGEESVFSGIERFGLKFANPLGLAAGFDKNGVVVEQLASLGFGFVEVGTVTNEPQPGNPKPRLFRLPEDHALINRLGFNNDGAVAVAARLKKLRHIGIVGVNIGKNKDVPIEQATENYVSCFETIQPSADYVAINVSSPNTAGLRSLQQADSLDELLGALGAKNIELGCKPLLVKIAPDLVEPEIEAIVDICLRRGLDGIIATNTTVSRVGLDTETSRIGEGGLSGKPLFNRSSEVVSTIFRYAKGRLPIIGVGGIFDAEDAFDKIAAGASLVQAYTGFVYGGPSFARDITFGLAAILKARGFSSVDEAVGSAVHL